MIYTITFHTFQRCDAMPRPTEWLVTMTAQLMGRCAPSTRLAKRNGPGAGEPHSLRSVSYSFSRVCCWWDWMSDQSCMCMYPCTVCSKIRWPTRLSCFLFASIKPFCCGIEVSPLIPRIIAKDRILYVAESPYWGLEHVAFVPDQVLPALRERRVFIRKLQHQWDAANWSECHREMLLTSHVLQSVLTSTITADGMSCKPSLPAQCFADLPTPHGPWESSTWCDSSWICYAFWKHNERPEYCCKPRRILGMYHYLPRCGTVLDRISQNCKSAEIGAERGSRYLIRGWSKQHRF